MAFKETKIKLGIGKGYTEKMEKFKVTDKSLLTKYSKLLK